MHDEDNFSDLLLKAYSVGLFPMAEDRDDEQIFWCDPEMRGLVPIQDFHIPKRLKPRLKKLDYDVRINHDFEGTMRGCASPEFGRDKTWINEMIIEEYCKLQQEGYAHSVEIYHKGTNDWIGGIYGVHLGAAFFGESMFSADKDGSKLALTHLVARLWAGDFKLFDVQFLTEHLSRFGGYEMPRDDYKRALFEAIAQKKNFIGTLKQGADKKDDDHSSGVNSSAEKPSSSGSSSGSASDVSGLSSSGFSSGITSEAALLSMFLQSRTQIS